MVGDIPWPGMLISSPGQSTADKDIDGSVTDDMTIAEGPPAETDNIPMDPAIMQSTSMPPIPQSQTSADPGAVIANAPWVLDENTMRSLQRFIESQGMHPISSDSVSRLSVLSIN